jgi:hypothetical protein
MTSVVDTIQQLDRAALDALIATDTATLDRLLSDSLIFVHPTGRVDTKAGYIASLLDHNPYISYEVVEQTIVPLGEAAVVTGELRTVVLRAAAYDNTTLTLRITCVWALEGRDWRLIRYQSTSVDSGGEGA